MQEKFSSRNFVRVNGVKSPGGNVLREIFVVKPSGGGGRKEASKSRKIDPQILVAKLRGEGESTARLRYPRR